MFNTNVNFGMGAYAPQSDHISSLVVVDNVNQMEAPNSDWVNSFGRYESDSNMMYSNWNQNSQIAMAHGQQTNPHQTMPYMNPIYNFPFTSYQYPQVS